MVGRHINFLLKKVRDVCPWEGAVRKWSHIYIVLRSCTSTGASRVEGGLSTQWTTNPSLPRSRSTGSTPSSTPTSLLPGGGNSSACGAYSRACATCLHSGGLGSNMLKTFFWQLLNFLKISIYLGYSCLMLGIQHCVQRNRGEGFCKICLYVAQF